MKKFLFNDNDKVLINELKNSTPIRIWSEYVRVVFEFQNNYIELECQDEIAESINDSDEAIICIIRKHNIKYLKSSSSKLIAENKKISDIKIVRTVLHFTKSKKIEPIPHNKNSFKSRLKKFITGEDDIISEILSMPSTGHSEIVSNPKSIKNNMPEFSNLIDVGLLIEIDNQYFQPIIKDNGYGFTGIGRKPFLSKEETNLELKNYELI
jgi:hypothetical protein